MITYDEAIDTRYGHSQEELAKRDNYGRYTEILEEASNHTRTLDMMRALINGVMTSMLEGGLDVRDMPLSLTMSAYLNGLVIGLEMNRPDEPEVTP